MLTLSIAKGDAERSRLRAQADFLLSKSLSVVPHTGGQTPSWSKIERLAASADNTTQSQWDRRGNGAVEPAQSEAARRPEPLLVCVQAPEVRPGRRVGQAGDAISIEPGLQHRGGGGGRWSLALTLAPSGERSTGCTEKKL